MRKFGTKLLIGLVMAVALAFGAGSDMRAAARAAVAGAVGASPASPAAPAAGDATGSIKEAAKPTARATTTAKPIAKPKTNPDATVAAVLPSHPLPGTSLAAAAAAAPQSGAANGKGVRNAAYYKKFQKMSPAAQKAAARQARALGVKPGVAGRNSLAATLAAPGVAGRNSLATTLAAPAGTVSALAAAPLPGTEGPGGIPHYFGPYGNWAFSPVPKGGVAAVTILDGGTGYNNPIIVIDDAYGTGGSFTIPTTQVGGVVQAPVIASPVGADISAPVATVVDDPALCGGGAQPACGTGALADATIGGAVIGGIRKFVDTLPGLGPAGANNLHQFIPVGVPTPWPLGCTGTACTADYYEIALVDTPSRCTPICRPRGCGATFRSSRPAGRGRMRWGMPDGGSPHHRQRTDPRRHDWRRPGLRRHEAPLPGADHRRQGPGPRRRGPRG